MEKHRDILEKYYEEIRENIKLDIDPSVFSAKCVSDYKEKKKIERDNERMRKKNLALEVTRMEKSEREELEKSIKGKSAKSNEQELKRLGQISAKEFGKGNGEGVSRSFKAIAKMFDIIRGE